MSLTPSSSSSSKIYKYDVFLSFRGSDTRRNFVSHLYNGMKKRGINVFKDDEGLEAGKSIPDELLKAIEESKYAIAIFSESYASSKWCLEELAHIMKCRNKLNQIVIPIFYNVTPSDVGHQNPPFADSFTKYEEKYKDDLNKVQTWRDAFAESGKISGYHLQNYKDEAACVDKVVEYILPNIIPTVLESIVETQIDKMMLLLYKEFDDDDLSSIGIDKTQLINSQIILDEGKLSFSLDKKTEKKSFMVAARALSIEWGNTSKHWEWLSHPASRFSEVAKLKSVCWLDIRGKIETGILSKKTKYVAYLVFKLETKFYGLENAKAVVKFVDFESDDDVEQRASDVHFSGRRPRETLPMRRGDGWLELKMGVFVNESGEEGEVDARLMETKQLNEKSGLIIQGVEFRPEE